MISYRTPTQKITKENLPGVFATAVPAIVVFYLCRCDGGTAMNVSAAAIMPAMPGESRE
jgi:hypothetical protein